MLIAMLTIECLFLSHREWNTIKVDVRTAERVAPVKRCVEANVGIFLLKMTPCSYHLYLFHNDILALFYYFCALSMIYCKNYTITKSFSTFVDCQINCFHCCECYHYKRIVRCLHFRPVGSNLKLPRPSYKKLYIIYNDG